MKKTSWILSTVMVAIGFHATMGNEPDTGEEILFEDAFDKQLADGWSWLRENKDTWRLNDGALEIRVQPGLAHNVKNALVRQRPIAARELSRSKSPSQT